MYLPEFVQTVLAWIGAAVVILVVAVLIAAAWTWLDSKNKRSLK